MSDIKVFFVNGKCVTEIEEQSVGLEKSLQTLIEKNLETFVGVRWLASEYATGKAYGGRIDTLGIDENGSPVIIEYKRSLDVSVINQGLSYLDWLLDHQADFRLLVEDKLGPERARKIDWSAPRLLCIAGDFTKYDERAVAQIDQNIELLRYKRFEDAIVLLELVNGTTARPPSHPPGRDVGGRQPGGPRPPHGPRGSASVSKHLSKADAELRHLFEATEKFLRGLGNDVRMNVLKKYIAFRRFKNFACMEVYNREKLLRVYLQVNPKQVTIEKGFTRDMTGVGHYGTGHLAVDLKTLADLKKAKPLMLKSYKAS